MEMTEDNDQDVAGLVRIATDSIAYLIPLIEPEKRLQAVSPMMTQNLRLLIGDERFYAARAQHRGETSE
jgi:hypothetical protein